MGNHRNGKIVITQSEVLKISDQLNVDALVIDKDWILGHFLNAMFGFEDIRNNFVFKGGTCLKKCYDEEYRFSEDLDFTLIDSEFMVDSSFINKVITQTEKISGVRLHLKYIKDQVYNDIPQGYEIMILYWGANHKPNQKPLPVNRWKTKLKMDISFSEKVLAETNVRVIKHPYSDFEKILNTVLTYSLAEIIAEKLRTLLQRNRARDIYDLYYLSTTIDGCSFGEILALLRKKSELKGIKFSRSSDFCNDDKANRIKRAWQSSLGSHLPKGKLPAFDECYQQVKLLLGKVLKGDD
jgi:predicted nucleotidyltransferase component of viral defense system